MRTGALTQVMANTKLVGFPAKLFGLPSCGIIISSGHTSRNKRVLMKGLGMSTIIDRLRDKIGPEGNAGNA